MTKPKRYEMSKPEEIKRWFREMEGYLKCGSETKHDFLNQGTDFDGRCFAMDGFRQLRKIMFKKINSSTSNEGTELSSSDSLRLSKSCPYCKSKDITLRTTQVNYCRNCQFAWGKTSDD